MDTFIAFLRGINVGGKVLLPMKDLAALCSEAGLNEVKTYINSGNVIFKSSLGEEKLVATIEKVLLKKMDRKIDVVIRSGNELKNILKTNPFPKANPSQVGVLLFTQPLPKNLLANLNNPGPEQLKLFRRELYINYPNGMGQTKLKLPAITKTGTMRNINTISKLAEMAK